MSTVQVYNRKALAVLLSAIIIMSSALVFTFTTQTGTAYGSYYDLGVQLTPEGPVKLGVGESKTFTATITGGQYPYTFTWTKQVHYTDNTTGEIETLKIDAFEAVWTYKYFGSEKPVSTYTFEGFPEATQDYFVLMVTVQDATGAKQVEICYVFDPYTSPTQILNGANSAAYTTKVQADNLGWFRAITGEDNAILTSSTTAATVINAATALGGTVILMGDSTVSVTYPINTDILVTKSRTQLIGVGNVTIQALSGAADMIDIAGSATPAVWNLENNYIFYPHVDNLILDGNYNAINGVYLNNTFGATVNGVRAFNMTNCIWVDYNSQDTTISQCTLGESWTSIIINGTRNQGFVSRDNWLGHNTVAGVQVTNNNENVKLTFDRTFLTVCNNNGFYFPSTDNQTIIGLTIRDCWVEDTFSGPATGYSIYIKNAATPTITGNFLYRSAQQGAEHIYLYNVNDGDILNNYIYGGNSTMPSVTLTGVSQYNTFKSNQLYGQNIAYYLSGANTVGNYIYNSTSTDGTFLYAPDSLAQNNLYGFTS